MPRLRYILPLLVVLLLPAVARATCTTSPCTFTIAASTSDYYCRGGPDATWDATHPPFSTCADTTQPDVSVGRFKSGGNYYNDMGYLKWDTNGLPDDAVNMTATITLKAGATVGTSGNLIGEWAASWTPNSSDYQVAVISATAFSVAMNTFTANTAHSAITLSNTTSANIIRNGTTYMRLGGSASSAPTALENYMLIKDYAGDSANTATLIVTFDTPTATPTSTPTNTPTRTPTVTPTSTNTPTNSPTAPNTNTPTNTPTVTPTASNTPTVTPTATPTVTPTVTPTSTITPTNTSTATPTNTPTITPTNTPTPTITNTPTVTPTRTTAPTIHAGVDCCQCSGGANSCLTTGSCDGILVANATCDGFTGLCVPRPCCECATGCAEQGPTNDCGAVCTPVAGAVCIGDVACATYTPTPTATNTPTNSPTPTITPTNTPTPTITRTPTPTLPVYPCCNCPDGSPTPGVALCYNPTTNCGDCIAVGNSVCPNDIACVTVTPQATRTPAPTVPAGGCCSCGGGAASCFNGPGGHCDGVVVPGAVCDADGLCSTPTATPTVVPTIGAGQCCACYGPANSCLSSGHCDGVLIAGACIGSVCTAFTPTPTVTPTPLPTMIAANCCQCSLGGVSCFAGHGTCDGVEIPGATCFNGGCATFTPTPLFSPTPWPTEMPADWTDSTHYDQQQTLPIGSLQPDETREICAEWGERRTVPFAHCAVTGDHPAAACRVDNDCGTSTPCAVTPYGVEASIVASNTTELRVVVRRPWDAFAACALVKNIGGGAVAEYVTIRGYYNGPPVTSCFQRHQSAGCNDAACMNLVCGEPQNPGPGQYCCFDGGAQGWDAACVVAAGVNGCTTPTATSTATPTVTPTNTPVPTPT